MDGPPKLASIEKGAGVEGVTYEGTRDVHGRWALTQKLNASRTPNYVWVDDNLERHEVARPAREREARLRVLCGGLAR